MKPVMHDQVLVEAEIDGRVAGFRSVVVNVLPGVLWLGLPKANPLLEKLQPNDPAILTFRREGAAMVAQSAFVSHLGPSPSRVFSVEWPEDVRMVQRRAHLRIDAEGPVQYTIIETVTDYEGIKGHGSMRNLSAGGVQFAVKAPVDETVIVGDVLELRMGLGQNVVMADATVVRVENATDLGRDGKLLPPARNPRPPLTHLAVRFEQISEGAQDLIVRHIFALQRMRR